MLPDFLPTTKLETTEPRCLPKTRCFADIEPETISWLWPGKIPQGKLTFFAGNPGVGKSIAALDVAARLSRGRDWPDGSHNPEPGKVAIIAAEDDPGDTQRPRLDMLGADVSRIELIEGKFFEDEPEDVSSISLDIIGMTAIRHLDVDLLIVDTFTHFVLGDNSPSEMKQAMRPLVEWAMETNTAVICIEHLNKDSTKMPMHRLLGSVSILGQARAVWGFGRDPQDEERLIMVSMKANLAKNNEALACRLISVDGKDHPRLEWEEAPVMMTAEELFSPPKKSPGQQRACELLKEVMPNGTEYASEVYTQFDEEGLSAATARKALSQLGGTFEKEGFGGRMIWRIPIDSPSPQGEKV